MSWHHVLHKMHFTAQPGICQHAGGGGGGERGGAGGGGAGGAGGAGVKTELPRSTASFSIRHASAAKGEPNMSSLVDQGQKVPMQDNQLFPQF